MTEVKQPISKQNKIILFLMALIFAIFFIATPINLIVSASTENSSPVLSDLQKDENFNVGDYPAVDNKYELSIIQVAETTTNDCLVYVYMPCARAKELQLTTISISTELDDNNPDFNLYRLSLLNSSGVFFKYLVEDLKPSNDIMRKYNISEVHRVFDEEIDQQPGNNQTISEVPHEIAQTWTTTTINGEVYYQRVNNEVVTIEEKYVGFLRYETSYWLTGGACDGHFVAFSTDYKIDQLYEADISFVHRTYKKKTDMGLNVGGGEQIVSLDNEASVFAFGDTTWTYGDYVTTKKTIKYTDKATIQQGHFITNSYSWNRIESVEEFIEKEDLTNTTINALKNKQWVLRFHETDFAKWSDSIGVIQAYKYESGTQVEDVTILRLKFKTDGKVYNLGVVDNKQAGSGIQDNVKRTWWQKVWETIVTILKVVGIVIGGIIAIKIITIIINLIKAILK